MEVVGETSTSIVVDGNLGWGQVICGQTMEVVARKAKESGLAMSAIRNSGHMGRVGYWAEQLANDDLISLHFLNTTGKGMMAVPFGGTDRRLSLCAIAACVPVEQRPPLLLDFTTTVMAEGKLRVALNQGVAVPPGTIVDKQGQPTTDPKAFYDGGALLPIAAHKGHGLNMIADILSGALSGGGLYCPGCDHSAKHTDHDRYRSHALGGPAGVLYRNQKVLRLGHRFSTPNSWKRCFSTRRNGTSNAATKKTKRYFA